jgi:4-hydroxy-tetrahydrodipicolinate synthase
MLSGVITALVSPFKNGMLDQNSFVKLLHQQLEQKVDGFVVNGTTGESPTLKLSEIQTLVELVRAETRGTGLKLLIGTGTNSTDTTVELSAAASAMNPDALLVVVPYYNRPPQRGLVQHFTAAARASKTPIVLYNVPSRTVASLEPETIATLSRMEGITGIKDATGDMEVFERIRKLVSRKDFAFLSGDDATCVDYAFRGGSGVITVSSHIIGKEMIEAIKKAKGGDASASSAYRERFQELLKWLYIEANPIPVKMALYWMGILESPEMRLPLMSLDEKFHGEFKACLKNLGKL